MRTLRLAWVRDMKYGWKQSPKDDRDYKFDPKFGGSKIPPVIDLSCLCSPVKNQGELSSCVAHAIAGSLEFLENAKTGNTSSFWNASRLFIYYNGRSIEGTQDQDQGMYIRDGIKAVSKSGYCHENLWMYLDDLVNQKPSDSCFEDGSKNTISVYERLTSDQIVSALCEGLPVVGGINVYPEFEGDKIASTGILDMPEEGEECLGGHAILIVGYILSRALFIVRNSWGDKWGRNGYFLMPFEYATKYGSDFWVIRK